MERKLPRPEFLTLAELAGRWGYSEEYVHDLIRTGKIIPEIALSDSERYVGGEFSGGYLVGDIENAKHRSYSEYYVGTVTDQDDHYENRPQCSRLVYCHGPVDDGKGGYLFQFVSESPYPGETEKWFYLDHAAHIGSADWKRFRFVWQEIERYEHENGTFQKSAPEEQRVVRNKLETRKHVLDAEIVKAREAALDPADANSVWTELLKMAGKKMGCLLEVVDGELKYDNHGTIEVYTIRAFREKFRRMTAR